MNETYLIVGLFNIVIVVFFYKRYIVKVSHNEKERRSNHEDTEFIMDFLKEENERLRNENERIKKEVVSLLTKGKG